MEQAAKNGDGGDGERGRLEAAVGEGRAALEEAQRLVAESGKKEQEARDLLAHQQVRACVGVPVAEGIVRV